MVRIIHERVKEFDEGSGTSQKRMVASFAYFNLILEEQTREKREQKVYSKHELQPNIKTMPATDMTGCRRVLVINIEKSQCDTAI